MTRDVMPLLGAQVRLQHDQWSYTFYILFTVFWRWGLCRMHYLLLNFKSYHAVPMVPCASEHTTMPGISLIFNKMFSECIILEENNIFMQLPWKQGNEAVSNIPGSNWETPIGTHQSAILTLALKLKKQNSGPSKHSSSQPLFHSPGHWLPHWVSHFAEYTKSIIIKGCERQNFLENCFDY